MATVISYFYFPPLFSFATSQTIRSLTLLSDDDLVFNSQGLRVVIAGHPETTGDHQAVVPGRLCIDRYVRQLRRGRVGEQRDRQRAKADSHDLLHGAVTSPKG